MLKIEKFQATPVEAVQVTDKNRQEIANWCGGRTTVAAREGGPDIVTLFIPIRGPKGNREQVAKRNYWVVKEGGGAFRIFYDKAFRKIFHKVEEQPELDFGETYAAPQEHFNYNEIGLSPETIKEVQMMFPPQPKEYKIVEDEVVLKNPEVVIQQEPGEGVGPIEVAEVEPERVVVVPPPGVEDGSGIVVHNPTPDISVPAE